MEKESRMDTNLDGPEYKKSEKIVRIENNNSRDSCCFMKYFLGGVMIGVPFTGCPKYHKEKELTGHDIEDVMVLREGELTMEHDTRKYYVCLVIRTKENKYYPLIIAEQGDTVEWNDGAQALKVIRCDKDILTLKRDFAREEREKNLA